ncbi:magnesium transporter Alr1p [Monosporozyma unispora]|nr:Mg(2+) transporter [Kazachstania unispora]
MSSISSDDSHVSLDSSDNSALISSGSSMASMNTRDHNELYDHRQHPDFDNNIENTTTVTQTNSNAIGPQITNVVTDTNNNNNNLTTPASNKTPEKAGVHYTTHQSPIPLPASSKNVKQPGPPPPHRYRRYSHQSYLGAPPISSFYQQSHGPTDPVIEAAEMASHRFNSSARPSRLEHCIHTESLPSPYPTPINNAHPHNNNIQFVDRKESLPNMNSQKPHSARRLSKIHSSADPISPRMNLRKTRSDSVSSQFDIRNVSGNSNNAANIPNNSNTLVTAKTNPLGDNNHGSAIKLTRTKSSESNNAQGLNRKTTRGSYDSDDSQGSRDTQETEEDVCFPMEPQLHTRANGIDFDELEEFAQYTRQMREEYLASMRPNSPESKEGKMDVSTSSGTSLSRMSSAALKYTPRPSAQQEPSSSQSNSSESKKEEAEEIEKVSYVSPLPEIPGVQFDTRNKIEGEDEHENAYQSRVFTQDYTPTDYSNNNFVIPNRFSFFCSDSEETIHTTDIASLVTPGQSFYDLFRGGEPTWWLDCTCPTDDEMRCLAKAFGIHPLTAEDIRIQETREKVELFKSYYFVCFHTFENDKESEDFLEPINVYLVVFRTGILSFHFGPISHCASVRRRVRQLRDYVDVNSDWLCYALIDDITDSFAPVIQSIEYEADVIEDSVFMARDVDFSAMLQRIGESRKKTMTLMRLLSGKADVIKMFAKRCQEEANGIGPALTSDINIANLHAGDYSDGQRAQPRGDIAMYLGDIQDHLLTMYQNLAAYEKIFSRSHTNYLAQLQVESFNSNNKVTDILGKATIIGTIFVPLNVITGLFGMNVKVPGQDSSIAWWFGILGVLIGLACGGFIFSTYWIGRITPPTTLNEAAESGATSVIPSIFGKGRSNKRRNFQDPRINPSTGSINSLPSRLSRYK